MEALEQSLIDVIDVVLVFLLSTFNISHIFWGVFIADF